MSTNAELSTAVGDHVVPTNVSNTIADSDAATAPALAPAAAPYNEALALRRNLLQSLWVSVRQLPRGRRIVLIVRLVIYLAQIIAFIPILALPGSNRVSPSHEQGRVCDPDSLFKYLVIHIVRLAVDIPVELYLGLSPHRTRQGRRASPEARAAAERDRLVGSEWLDTKLSKISTLLGLAAFVMFFVGNAIVYSSTECSRKPAEAVPLFWSALASLIVVYVFILEVALLAFLIVCALPLLIAILRALGLSQRLPQRELHPETGKIDQQEVDKRVKLVYYTPAEEEEEGQTEQNDTPTAADASQAVEQRGATAAVETASTSSTTRPDLGSRRATQDSVHTNSHPALGHFGRLTRLLVSRRRSDSPSSRSNRGKAASTASTPGASTSNTVQAEDKPSVTDSKSKRGKLKYPLHPLPAHRATCPICLCDFEEPNPDEQEPEPEPLRLLECGHVMHRSCVDQWLTTVSGRCPVCQRAVIPEPGEEGNAQQQETARAAEPAQPVEEVHELQPLEPPSTCTRPTSQP